MITVSLEEQIPYKMLQIIHATKKEKFKYHTTEINILKTTTGEKKKWLSCHVDVN